MTVKRREKKSEAKISMLVASPRKILSRLSLFLDSDSSRERSNNNKRKFKFKTKHTMQEPARRSERRKHNSNRKTKKTCLQIAEAERPREAFRIAVPSPLEKKETKNEFISNN
jgi:hypothetical protein